jgi:hypothetical protein
MSILNNYQGTLVKCNRVNASCLGNNNNDLSASLEILLDKISTTRENALPMGWFLTCHGPYKRLARDGVRIQGMCLVAVLSSAKIPCNHGMVVSVDLRAAHQHDQAEVQVHGCYE